MVENMAKNMLRAILFLLAGVVLECCTSEKKQIKDNLELMTSTPINLSLDKMEARRNPLVKSDSKFKMVVYVDSSECSPCALSHLRFWNPLIKEARQKKISIDYIFILAPKMQEMPDVDLELEVTDLPASIYVDTAFVFKKANSFLPKDKKYHSFLLNKNSKVIFVGNPLGSDKLEKIYKQKISVK